MARSFLAFAIWLLFLFPAELLLVAARHNLPPVTDLATPALYARATSTKKTSSSTKKASSTSTKKSSTSTKKTTSTSTKKTTTTSTKKTTTTSTKKTTTTSTKKTTTTTSKSTSKSTTTTSKTSSKPTSSTTSKSTTTSSKPTSSTTSKSTTTSSKPTSSTTSKSTTTTSSSTKSTTTTTTSATPTATFKPLTGDLQVVFPRAIDFVAQSVGGYSSIQTLLNTQNADGSWPDVDYSTGCAAQRANWPAQNHWSHVNLLAAAYHGTVGSGTAYVNSSILRPAIDKGMNWWFSRDFKDPDCVDQGGTTLCPCGTAGMWNTNWFSNVIGTPSLVGRTCLLLRDATPSLTGDQISNCTSFTARAFGRFGTGAGYLSGTNILDIATIGVYNALLAANTTVMTQAYQYIHNEVIVHNQVKVDGIKGDGSFQQHAGLIYNGNYGKGYTNDVLMLEIQAAGTQWAAATTSPSLNAFTQFVDGFTWTVFQNIARSVLRWDISVIGRFIAFPIADYQAGTSIDLNLTSIDVLATMWNEPRLKSAIARLKAGGATANVGDFNGNRMFFQSDYMIQRAAGVVTSLRMYSTRTINTECVNLANPLGFHLADGTIYTHMTGSEYEDVAASWDWNLIPGTTVDYGSTSLVCDGSTKNTGTQSFVGGASDGKVGVAAMSYSNPVTKAFGWKKAYFFFEDGTQRVVVNSISTTAANAGKFPVVTVLDQKRRKGDVWVDGVLAYASGLGTGGVVSGQPAGSANASFPDVGSVWHDNVGYVFDSDQDVSLYAGQRTGSWSALGTSGAPPTTVELFGAWIKHNDATAFNQSIGYTIYPATSVSDFEIARQSTSSDFQPLEVPSSPSSPPSSMNGVLDVSRGTAMVVFWSSTGGSVSIPFDGDEQPPVSVSVDKAVTMIVRRGEGITVADPAQTVKSVVVTLKWVNWDQPATPSSKLVDPLDGAGATSSDDSATPTDSSTSSSTSDSGSSDPTPPPSGSGVDPTASPDSTPTSPDPTPIDPNTDSSSSAPTPSSSSSSSSSSSVDTDPNPDTPDQQPPSNDRRRHVFAHRDGWKMHVGHGHGHALAARGRGHGHAAHSHSQRDHYRRLGGHGAGKRRTDTPSSTLTNSSNSGGAKVGNKRAESRSMSTGARVAARAVTTTTRTITVTLPTSTPGASVTISIDA